MNIRQPDPADRIELVEQPPSAGKAASVYAQVGGDPPFRRLVETFYAKIERDPVLRPLFPSDLTEGKENQFLFLTQFFGGPPRYTAKRGHPRLRARHLAFPIGRREAETWLGPSTKSVSPSRRARRCARTLPTRLASCKTENPEPEPHSW